MTIFLRTGVALGLYSVDADFQMEVERASDSAGAPDVANAKVIAVLEGQKPGAVYVDRLPLDSVMRHYRWRQIRDGYDPGAWSEWKAAQPVRLPSGEISLPPLESAPILDLLELATSTTTQADIEITAAVGTGGRAPLEYRYRVADRTGVITDFAAAWGALASPETITVPRGKHLRRVTVEVRDADGRTTAKTDAIAGKIVSSPILNPSVTLNADGTAADLSVTIDSPAEENLRLHFRDSLTSVIWSLVAGNGDPTPRYVAPETTLGPTDWFYNGSTYAQKLNDIALTRDQVTRVFLQTEGQSSGLKSLGVPVSLDLKGTPWLEKADAVWDEKNDQLKLKVTAGAHCKSVTLEVKDEAGAAIAHANLGTVNLADGATRETTVPLASLSRGAVWSFHATPHNALAGAGLAGVAHVDPELIPASEGGGPEPPTVELLELDTSTRTTAKVKITGAVGEGGTAPLEYAYRVVDILSAAPAFSAWAALGSGVTIDVARAPFWTKRLEAKVRDADVRESDPEGLKVQARLPSIEDPADGRVRFLKRAGTLDEDADNLFKRGVNTLGDVLDDATYRKTTLSEADQATNPSQNLLGPNVGPPHTSTTYYAGPLEDVRLNVGDTISWRGQAKAAAGNTNNARIRVEFKDGAGTVLSTVESNHVVGTGAWEDMVKEKVVIPTGTVSISVHSTQSSSAGGLQFRRVMLNRGPVALPFEEPPFRSQRETADDVTESAARSYILPDYVDGSRRVTTVRRDAADEAAENLFKRGVNTLLDVLDDATYRKTTIAEADQATEPSQNLLGIGAGPVTSSSKTYFNGSVDTLAVTAGQSVVSARVEASADAGTNNNARIRIYCYDAAGTLLQGFESNHVDGQGQGVWGVARIDNAAIPANTTRLQVYTTQSTASGGLKYRRAMLNHGPLALPFEEPSFRLDREVRLPGQNHVPMVGTANQRTVQVVTDGSKNLIEGVDAIVGASINIAGHDVKMGGLTVAYGSGSITGLANSTLYYVYVDDAEYRGGAVTYSATTDPAVLLGADARYYVGKVTTPADGGTSTGGGGGGGGGIEPV